MLSSRKYQENGENFRMGSFMIFPPHQILLGRSNQAAGQEERSMWQAWERREIHEGFWWGNLNERDHLDDLGVDGNINLERVF